MSMRPLLAVLRVKADPFVLAEITQRTETAVPVKIIESHAAAAIVRAQKKLSGRIDTDVAGALSSTGKGVQDVEGGGLFFTGGVPGRFFARGSCRGPGLFFQRVDCAAAF